MRRSRTAVSSAPATKADSLDPHLPSRILVVDDDADAAWALAELIRSTLGCEVRTALGGADAIEDASCNRPGAVLIDIVMPRIDGIEVAGILRRLFPADERPRLIALTGMDLHHWAGPPIESTFDRCLRKPLEIDALVRALRD